MVVLPVFVFLLHILNLNQINLFQNGSCCDRISDTNIVIKNFTNSSWIFTTALEDTTCHWQSMV